MALIAGLSFLQCAAGPSPEAEGNRPRRGKIASVLRELATASDRGGYAKSRGILLSEGRVRVLIFMSASATDTDRKRLVEEYGLIVEKAAGGLMRTLVPVDALMALSGDTAVSFIDLPARPGI